MQVDFIIAELNRNKNVIEHLLSGISEEQQTWKPESDKWCLLEIICHLYDEEREDFRARVKHTLETPNEIMPSIDPAGWVNNRKYIEQPYNQKLQDFLDERTISVDWLKTLENPAWDNYYAHPTLGNLTAYQFLANWLVHDQIHIRQINRTKHQYFARLKEVDLGYSGGF